MVVGQERECLIRGKFQHLERPILVNNWEATYFDFDAEKILAIAKEGRELGIELFVLDDGWFGERNSDTTSLGDWFENKDKLSIGLKGIADSIHENGMKFGLWFEPEMISKKSKLYDDHPDWVIHIPTRGKSKGRDQYVLDFSQEDVRKNIYQQMKAILDVIPIDYIKWDYNRSMTEIFSTGLESHHQGEVTHRYVLGLYAFLDKLITEYPNILFESCSGGGGRFDPGMLYYMPQTWTSDNTDAIDRLKIQYGTSLVYPIVTMGAHVSEVPNHQVGRVTSFKTRGNVAMAGNFGYELDLLKLTVSQKELVKQQVDFYKKHRVLIQYGDFYRLLSPFEGNVAAWMFVSEDKKEALVFYYRVLGEATPILRVLKLDGLKADWNYYFEHNDTLYCGDELMNSGFYVSLDFKGDYDSSVFYLKMVN